MSMRNEPALRMEKYEYDSSAVKAAALINEKKKQNIVTRAITRPRWKRMRMIVHTIALTMR